MRDHNAIVVCSVYAGVLLLILISRAKARSSSKRARFEQPAQRLPGRRHHNVTGDELARKRNARRGGRDLTGPAGRSPSPAAASPSFVQMIHDAHNVVPLHPDRSHKPNGVQRHLKPAPNDAA